jgi:hypothetical protein
MRHLGDSNGPRSLCVQFRCEHPQCAVVITRRLFPTALHKHTYTLALHVEHQFYLSGLIKPVCGHKR